MRLPLLDNGISLQQGGKVLTFNDGNDIFVEFELEEECMVMQNLRNDRGVLKISKASNFKKKVKQ